MIPYNKRKSKAILNQLLMAILMTIACVGLVWIATYLETGNHPYKLW
jgi:hypothetical protein